MSIPFQQSNTRLDAPERGMPSISGSNMGETLGTAGKVIGRMFEMSAEADEKLRAAQSASEIVEADNDLSFKINDLFNESQADDFKNTGQYEEKFQKLTEGYKFTDPAVGERFTIHAKQKVAKGFMSVVNKNIERNQEAAIASLNDNTGIARSSYVGASSDEERNAIMADMAGKIDMYTQTGIISALDGQKRKASLQGDFEDAYITGLIDNDYEAAAAYLNSGKAKVSSDDRDKFMRMVNEKQKREEKLKKEFTEQTREYNARKTFLSMTQGQVSPDSIADLVMTGDISTEDGNLFMAKLSKASAAMPKTDPEEYLKVVNEITKDDVSVKDARRLLMKSNINGFLSDEDMNRLFSYKVMGRDGQISLDAYARKDVQTAWGKAYGLAAKAIIAAFESPVAASLRGTGLPQSESSTKRYMALKSFDQKIEEAKPKEEDVLKLAKIAIEEQFMKDKPEYAIRGVPDRSYAKDGTMRTVIGSGSRATAQYDYKNGRLVKRGEE